MRALQLVTTPRPFFDQQRRALERVGVECRTVAVHRSTAGADRSAAEYLGFLPRTLRRALDRFDVVHANHGLTAPFALAQPTRPVVLTFWGSDLLGDQTPLHRAVRRSSRLTARLADAVVVPTTDMAARLDVASTVVPFGVDTTRFRPIPRAEARARVGWPADGDVALFAADPARPEKDVARAEAVAERAGAQLKVVSSVPHRSMPDYLNASDLLLVTSRHESGPMVVKEAAACNVPVVSTDVGFVSEVLDGVANSAVCGDTDGLVEAVERVLASDRRSDGRSAVSGLDLEAMGRALRRVYDRSLAGR